MLRAADLLERELLSSGIEVVVCRPQRFFGRIARAGSRLTKWLAYLDKYLLFPFCLIWQGRRAKAVLFTSEKESRLAEKTFWPAGNYRRLIVPLGVPSAPSETSVLRALAGAG